MKVARYSWCWMGNESSGRGCEIEEIYNEDSTAILGPGVVLYKCERHKDIPDDELYAVIHSEMRQVQVLRKLEGDAVKLRFEGRGKNRVLRVL